MLQEIYINNFVLIDELRLQVFDGLNVLTGETGAGKSIIIDALNLILGERIKTDFIRDGSHKAIAEAVFDVSANEEARIFLIENELLDKDEGTIIITREILPTGRSSARINGRNVPLSVVKTLADYLVDMHLQHDNQSILKPVKYIYYVDSFHPQIENAVNQVGELFNQWKDSQRQLEEMKINRQQRGQQRELLSHQIEEIESSKLQQGEEEELSLLRDKIRNAHKLIAGAVKILALLYSSDDKPAAYDLISASLDTARGLDSYEIFASLAGSLEQISYSLEDMAGSLASFKDSLDFEPGLLDGVEERLYQIRKLKSKYGESIEDILFYLDKVKQEMEELGSGQEREAELEKKIALLAAEYGAEASRLTEMRIEAASILEKNVHNELQQLNMPHIQFVVKLTKCEKPGPRGVDAIEFLFSPNPGEAAMPISQVASGGEISRFILALKKALAEVYQIPTLIFDEIDVGLGGTALNTVAEKLYELSCSHQVILVTHSPQVASYADNHYIIEKQVKNNHTYTIVAQLEGEARIKELARMLGGDKYTPLTLEHAREMLAQAKKY